MTKRIKTRWVKGNSPKIRGLLAEHGFTQKDMALWLDITERSVINKLDGTTMFKEKEIKTLAETFGVDVSILAVDW